MVLLAGGSFVMGTDHGLAAEAPAHTVVVGAFWIDTREVTVAEFARFVRATGYRTDAERFGWSGVFDRSNRAWRRVDGASWRRPDAAPGAPRPDEPVTQVSWNDAAAYLRWAGKRLPTEAEFEYAARGGRHTEYPWGDERDPSGRFAANYWQGVFPERDKGGDGFAGRAPAGSFPPNGYGLLDMVGNVWEWCGDWFDPEAYKRPPARDPRGPASGTERVIRGGSWLCAENYCRGYRVAARNKTPPDTALNNLGFRGVRDAGSKRP